MNLFLDGWTNVLTKLGIRGADKSQSMSPSAPRLLSDSELGAIYVNGGAGAKISEVVPEDALRNGFTIDGDTDGSLLKQARTTGLIPAVQLAHTYSRAFGGALIVADYVSDSQPLEKAPAPTAIAVGFKVYPASRVPITDELIVREPSSKYFDSVEVFNISKRFGGSAAVHAARCYAIKGTPFPDIEDLALTTHQLFWGSSATQKVYDALSNFGAFVQGIGHLGQEMVIGKYRIANLEKLLISNDVKAIQTRMEVISMSKSLIKSVLLGKDEEYTRDTINFGGVPEVFDRLAMVLSGASGIPVTKLFGRSAAGMNATGEGDSRDYYDGVKATQQFVLADPLGWAVSQLERRGKQLRTVTFHPVWTPTMREELEMRERQQKIDAGYIADGVYGPEVVQTCRFTADGYSFDTKIEVAAAADAADLAAYQKQLEGV